MSQNATTTSWVLKLVDEMTKPMKNVMNSVKKATSFIDDMGTAVKLSEKDTKTALGNAKKHYSDLEKQVKATEKELKDLDKAQKSSNWSEAMEASKAYDKAKQKVERLRTALQGADKDVKDLTNQTEKFNQKSESWTNVATGINQATELMQKAVSGLDFTVDVKNFTNEVQRMTDLSGKELDNFVMKSRKIADVYNQDAYEIAQAANAMTKQVGGSYEDNLSLIEQGFKNGANTNKDFLDQLKEFAPVIKHLGLSQEQAIALIAKSGKDGVFSDKAIDSIGEADRALREMGKAQEDALAGIGLKKSDFDDKTSFEAIQMISQKMKGATTQAKQLILADIFKGAGEDGGLQMVEGFANSIPSLAEMPEVKQSGEGIKGFFSEIKTWIGQSFGDVGIYAQMMSPMIMTIASAIPIYQSLAKVTWLQNLATKALNVTQGITNALFISSPIGWVVLGIGALIGVIALCWNKFEGFRRVVFQGWEVLKLFGTVIKDYVLDRIKGLLSGITGIGKALMQFFNGEWSKAWETGKQAASDIVGIDAGVKAGNKFKEGWSGALADGLEAHNSNEAERNKQEGSSITAGINNYAKGTPDKLGDFNNGSGGKNQKEKGIDVGSGSLKSIVMNLTVNNAFSVAQGMNVRQMADKITSEINDRLRDGVISLS